MTPSYQRKVVGRTLTPEGNVQERKGDQKGNDQKCGSEGALELSNFRTGTLERGGLVG